MTPAFSMYSYRQRLLTSALNERQAKRAVHLHGYTPTISDERPPDPTSLLVGNHLDESVSKVTNTLYTSTFLYRECKDLFTLHPPSSLY